jgi:hypothetical protein
LATLTQAAPRAIKQRTRRTNRDQLASLFMAAWICILLQGALRKWIFPGSAALYLIQDVPLTFAYVFALWKGLVWGGKLAWMCVLVSAALAIQTMLQVIFGNLQLRTAVMGLHQYIYYLPILFLVPVCFNFKHRRRFIRWNMLVIVPMALIAALQSRAPSGAWINRTSAGEDTGLGGLSAGHVRATGTFNFTVSYAIWCGFAVGLVMGEWLLPPARRSFQSKAMLIICTMGAIVATLVSGSRVAVMLAAAAFLGGFAAVIVTRNVRLIVRFTAVTILLPLLVVISYFAAPSNFDAVVARFSGEGNQQSIEQRIDKMFTAFTWAASYSGLGVGIGVGIPAANPGHVAFVLSENESIRIVQEMGTYTGTILVLLRDAAGILLVLVSFRALQLAQGNRLPHAVPLAFSAAPTIMVGDLTHSAPVTATQAYFWTALILGALLFRHEPVPPGTSQLSKKR